MMLRPVSSVETILTLEHAGLEGSPAIGYGAGWEDFLVRLDAPPVARRRSRLRQLDRLALAVRSEISLLRR